MSLNIGLSWKITKNTYKYRFRYFLTKNTEEPKPGVSIYEAIITELNFLSTT